VPHLSEKTKRELLASTPKHLRLARSRGLPVLGSGMVFGQVPEDDITIEPIPIPDHWVQLGAMDFGWDHPFAAARLAWDRDTDVIYVTKDFRQSELAPVGARVAMAGWDLDWLPWAWPHDGLQHDKGSGEELANQYRTHGFRMMDERATFPDGGNGVEAGVSEMLDRMLTGRWKVFATCPLWLEEFRLYHRKDGQIVKKRDDVLSASRYGLMMRRYGRTRPRERTARHKTANWRTA
jgi:Terminase RNaseH-like domain